MAAWQCRIAEKSERVGECIIPVLELTSYIGVPIPELVIPQRALRIRGALVFDACGLWFVVRGTETWISSSVFEQRDGDCNRQN